PVEFGTADFEQRDAAVARDTHRLRDALVRLDAVREIERGGWHLGTQRLGHRVASDEQFGRRRLATRTAPLGRGRAPGGGGARPAAAARGGGGCPVRASAGGVGPLPRSARLRCPPEPTCAPFFDLRTAPCRRELPAIASAGSSAGRPACPRRPLRPP